MSGLRALRIDEMSNDEITTLLYKGLDDDGKTGDCIFVFGSVGTSRERTAQAVRLYQAGRAPKILFSGGDRWGKHDITDAERMKQIALQHGVPDEDILCEAVSNHTKENVIASLLVLDREMGLHRIKRLLVVTTPWHMLRCMLTLNTYMPDWIEFSWCAAHVPGQMKDDWQRNPNVVSLVRTEAKKLIQLVQEGQLLDAEIPIMGG
ncbi:YdcF family protein [Alicyclobacillus dauci]|uniref:YdcF family protein n=1 Tax=Alicyclobacillus dauci TaxID=1475485 RepID=A0ABY6Z851_9BACL|nr:YdcF family protein [Alicyclobacillus dauci]WAH38703.1 YdcF family protein [Alicyclobacillus dauci]